jgi:hypothetical protein
MPKPDIQKLFAAEIKRTERIIKAEAKRQAQIKKATDETLRLLQKALEQSKAGKKDLALATQARALKWKAKLDKIQGR